MSNAILLMGESGSGKTTSLRTLDPKTTFIFDCDGKGLSWRGWRKQYSTENKNYLKTDKVGTIEQVLKRIDGQDMTHIKVVVIDTLNMIMVNDEMDRERKKDFNAWMDLAKCIWGLLTDIHNLRDDLTVVCLAHTQTDRTESGFVFTKMKTSGRKLDKLCPESKFTTVLIAKANNGQYVIETRANNSTAKSPMGCFADSEIPNDMANIVETLKKYEEE